MSAAIEEHVDKLILDGTKIGWHMDRVQAWMDGKKVHLTSKASKASKARKLSSKRLDGREEGAFEGS